ncbi:MAG: DNA repair protein RecN, partial [Cyanobacteria bacterium J06632_3]
VAQAIAEKLHQLSREHQVLCVTHQPLVAAMADAHYHVGKHVVTASADKSAADSSSAVKKSAKKVKTAQQAEEAKARAKVAAQIESISDGKTASKKSKSKKSGVVATLEAADSGHPPASNDEGADGEERTIVKVTPLSDVAARRDELAQLAGGRSHSEAIAFADSLLAQAETIRKAG